MKNLLLILFALLFTCVSSAEEVLYCSPELATGFYNDSVEWKTTNTQLERFSVKVNDNFKSIQTGDYFYNCSVFFVGNNRAYICNNEFAGMDTGISFRYYPLTKRFISIHSSVSGYLDNETKFGELFSAGKCEKF